MSKKCAKCGRPIATKKLYCDECAALASEGETFEVVLELTQSELDIVAQTLKEEASNFRYTGGGDWDTEAETLDKVAQAFRDAPEDEHSRDAQGRYVQYWKVQEYEVTK